MSTSTDLITLKGWLNQTFPVLGVRNFFSASCHGNALRRSLNMARWEDLSESVRLYFEQSDDINAYLAPLSSIAEMLRLDQSNEIHALYSFQTLLRAFKKPLRREFFIQFEAPVTTSLESDRGSGGLAALAESSSRRRADIVVSLDEDSSTPVLVVEMKKPAVFRATRDSSIPILWDLAVVAGLDNSEAAAGDHVRLDAVRQLHGFMDGLGLKYGILTSFDVIYVACRREDCGKETLFISDGIARSDRDFLATLAYILSKSLNETAVFKRPDRKVIAPGSSTTPGSPGSSTAPGSEDVKTRKRKAEIPPTWEGRLRNRALRETPAEHLHLARRHFATGWSGKIVRGTYEGQSVVVKLAPVGSKRGEALLTEVEAYHMLKEVWGKYVPRLVSYGTTGGGSIMYIATEEIMGHEIGMGPLSQAVVEEIFNALAVVHQCGILHGDIQPNNILVTSGGQARVRFLDFGFACFVTSDVDCKRECA